MTSGNTRRDQVWRGTVADPSRRSWAAARMKTGEHKWPVGVNHMQGGLPLKWVGGGLMWPGGVAPGLKMIDKGYRGQRAPSNSGDKNWDQSEIPITMGTAEMLGERVGHACYPTDFQGEVR